MNSRKGKIPGAEKLSRRDFARVAAATAAGLAAIANPASAAALPFGMQEKTELPPEDQAEVRATVDAIYRKYGARLSEEQRADIERIVTSGQGGLEKLRAFQTMNGDAPATALRLYPPGYAGAKPENEGGHVR